MIFNIDDFKNQKELEEEFDLEKAIKSNEVDIIFCGISGYEETLNEYYEIYKNDKNIRLMIRNGHLDNIQQHSVTAKIIYPGCSKFNNHRGVPINFDNGKWYVALGTSKEKLAKAKNEEEKIRDKKYVKKFLDKVAKELGPEIKEYSNADPNIDRDKMNKIIESIKTKYNIEEED